MLDRVVVVRSLNANRKLSLEVAFANLVFNSDPVGISCAWQKGVALADGFKVFGPHRLINMPLMALVRELMVER